MHIRLLPVALTGLLTLGTSALAQPLRVPVAAASATALDRYVATPDPAYKWSVIATRQEGTLTVTTLEMTSQTWRTADEVDRTEWKHYLTVIRPDTVESDTSLLFIAGGSNDRAAIPKTDAMLAAIASGTRTIVSELRMIPNQPLTFFKDGVARKEDDLIAYGWDKFLDGGDEQWLARFPMTKAAVRAMDTVQAFAQSPEGGRRAITKFVVSGGSKRGWTTWTTAAVDKRVIAIAPAVIDLLNLEPSFVHHYRAYGAWSDAVKDYTEHGIMEWMGTSQFKALMRIEEPYEYRDRLTMPKLILNASGDQFFLPDSSQFYFDDLKGEKYLRYVPNTSHAIDKSDALETLHAFYASVVTGAARPQVKWSYEKDGSIKVTSKELPSDVQLWQATNPSARNFRLDAIGPAYKNTRLEPSGPNTWVGRVPVPAAGWTAFFIEMTFPGSGKYPLKLTTGIRVLPDTLPYAAPVGRPKTAQGASY